jgi:hypothetical protein
MFVWVRDMVFHLKEEQIDGVQEHVAEDISVR